jgi:hypothetical protein
MFLLWEDDVRTVIGRGKIHLPRKYATTNIVPFDFLRFFAIFMPLILIY